MSDHSLPSEVFLSHSDTDRQFVTQLATTLRQHGIRVWYSQTHVLGAQQWHDKIGTALRRCDWFALVLSPQAIESLWVKRELLFALQQNHFENRILPILHQPCDYERLSWTLSIFQIVDFTTGIFEDGCRELLRVWGIDHQSA